MVAAATGKMSHLKFSTTVAGIVEWERKRKDGVERAEEDSNSRGSRGFQHSYSPAIAEEMRELKWWL